MTREITLAVGQREHRQDVKDVKLLGVPIGSVAPEFVATTLEGKKIKLSDYRGKVVFIDFWATWCAPCLAELPNLKKAHQSFKDEGLVVIGISIDQNADMVKAFVRGRDIKWPLVVAEGADKGPLAKLYGVSGVPATFLVGPDGKVVAKDLRGTALHTRIRAELDKLKNKPTVTAQAEGR